MFCRLFELNRRRRQARHYRARSSRGLCTIEPLESRIALSFIGLFDSSSGAVSILGTNAAETGELKFEPDGDLLLDGNLVTDALGHCAARGNIHSLSVYGYGDNDVIDLGLLDSFSTSGVSIVVDGGGGSDTIKGSGIRDMIYGRAGNDMIYGGAGDDYVDGFTGNDTIYGGAGNDTLLGAEDSDYVDGGAGNDTLSSSFDTGNDKLYGGVGNDTIYGGVGNDTLSGGDGDDHLNGGFGNDSMWGENGNDVLIAIDNALNDYVNGGSGRDILWVDQNKFGFWSFSDTVAGVTPDDKVQYVTGFSNGADRTLDGDRLADPAVGAGITYKTFASNPLFAAAGPQAADVRQGGLGDCWLLAGLGAIANDDAFALRQNVVDFGDGTYGVRLGDKFYRVDNDLPVGSAWSTKPVYAALGAQNSMWVAVTEKAYAFYRTGANSYASLNGGWGVEVNRAFGTTAAGNRAIGGYASAAALANDIFNHWNAYDAVTIGFAGGSIAAGAPLINSHMYTVMWVSRDAWGNVISITLRNPWGVDGAGSDANPNDGLVTVTPGQLFGSTGRVNWGHV